MKHDLFNSRIVWQCCLLFITLITVTAARAQTHPRHCRGSVKHLHLSVGRDPTTQMTVSFASKWSYTGIEAPLGGVHVGKVPHQLDRFVPEQEYPDSYTSTLPRHPEQHYHSPFQHHITIDNLEPDTTYYFIAVVGNRTEGIDRLRETPFRDHPSQHQHENLVAENVLIEEHEQLYEDEDSARLLHHNNLRRKLAPPPYDGHEHECLEGWLVRSFKTAPVSQKDMPANFAIIGDLGQFAHSQETLEHMRDHRDGIQAVVLVGDIAYTELDHRRWDTFFDFIDDFSIFDEVPLQVAIGNHDIDKQENGNELFQAYETRFRMPQVHPPQIGTFDGPPGLLNMDAPAYPLPYEWGNAYYVFDYGPAKHIVVSAYSDMSPGSQQYEWIKEELEGANREVTPWLLVTIHVPLYNTFNKHHHDPQIFAAREHLEPLFVQHHVNVVFTGHIHAYQRTKNIAMGNQTETGPVHITVGAGGRDCDAPFMQVEPEDWLEQRDASYYGYGTFEIYNSTHAEWRWIPLSSSDKHDFNQVKGQDELHLPQLDHDVVVIENQHFIALQR